MTNVPKYNIYHIILVNHGKQLKDLYFTNSEAKVNKKFTEMLKENEKVKFPIKYNNEKTVIVEAEYELVIIKARQPNDSAVTKLRDEYGKFVNYESSMDEWIIYDRAPYSIEETFWVYGYHPKLQRKTFDWIFDEFIAKDAKDKYSFKSVQVYQNKLLIDCNGKLDMVLCKNKSDAIRLFNALEENAAKKKYKYVLFLGMVSDRRDKKQEWIKRIQDLTHWNINKITRRCTRP